MKKMCIRIILVSVWVLTTFAPARANPLTSISKTSCSTEQAPDVGCKSMMIRQEIKLRKFRKSRRSAMKCRRLMSNAPQVGRVRNLKKVIARTRKLFSKVHDFLGNYLSTSTSINANTQLARKTKQFLKNCKRCQSEMTTQPNRETFSFGENDRTPSDTCLYLAADTVHRASKAGNQQIEQDLSKAEFCFNYLNCFDRH